MINIFFTCFKSPLKQSIFLNYLSLLSPDLQEKNSRYIRWQNRHSHLFGKLLFIEALKTYGIEKDIWNYVEYNSYQRPCLTMQEYDFNISHSGDFVTCAIGKNVRLGIDIEENRSVDFKHFQDIMTIEEWDEINKANHPLKQFYKYWTIKESVIKADGRGLSLPLDKLNIKDNTVHYEDKFWFTKDLQFDSSYNATLAANKLSEFKIHEINF